MEESSNSDPADASTRNPVLTSVGTPPDEPPSEQEIADIARPGGALSLLNVFRHRNYQLFFTGQLVSLMGTWMQTIAQGWLVYKLTGSHLLLGLTAFCSQVTVFFMASLGGMIADRVDRRKMLLVTQGLAMLQAAVLAVLTLTGRVQVWEIIALAFGLGLINSVDVPTRQSMTLDMVGRGDLRHAIALNSMMFNLARVLGPAAAGWIIHLVGAGVCFGLNAFSFAAVLTSLFLMRLPERRARVQEHPLREVAEGYRYTLASPRILSSLMLVAVSSAFGAAYLSMMPAIASDVLHGDSRVLGNLWTSVGAGALIGAYLLSRVPERWLYTIPALASGAFGLCLVGFSQSRIEWLSMALLLPTACSLMLLGGTTNTIIQTTASENFRGRVISHYTQCFLGMMPWGSLMLGAVATRLGVADAVMIGGCVVIAAAGVAWFQRGSQATA